jgi:hypothetical protein
MQKSISKLVFILVIVALAACSGEEKGVYFVSLEDGATVTSPFKVEMGVKGMQVEPAGEVNEGFGHHHLIIDGSFIEEGVVVPANETHIHYGKGQTTTDDITLEPGKHTLTLQFADGVHTSFGESMSKTIEITVE